MRLLVRWFLNSAAAVSMFLCLVTCVLWARSYRHALEITDGALWAATGEQVLVERFYGATETAVSSSDWRFDLLGGRILMKSQVIRLNPPLNIGRRPEDGIGFTIRSYLMTPQEIRQRSEPIAEAEKAILADNGWTHRGFGYSCGRNRRIVPDEIGSDIERRALLPVWFLVFLFLGLPAFWTLRQIHVARSARFKTAGDRRAPTELCQGS